MSVPKEHRDEHPTPGWRKILEWAVTLGLLAFVLYRLGPQLGALTGVGPDLGRVPDLTIVTLDGDTLRSTELRGQVVVVNFWATWCGPCRLEMPSLQALHEDRAADGVVVIGLSTDVGSPEPIRSWIEERGIAFPIGRATRDHRSAFGGIRGIPTTYLIDREGVVRHRVVGYFAPPALRVAVGRLVDEGASGDTPVSLAP
jgi:thiol-disulfide isomerase/thioredoxin